MHRQPWPDTPGAYSYHAVFHDHATFGGHAYSEDALTWTYSLDVPFNNVVSTKTKTKTKTKHQPEKKEEK